MNRDLSDAALNEAEGDKRVGGGGGGGVGAGGTSGVPNGPEGSPKAGPLGQREGSPKAPLSGQIPGSPKIPPQRGGGVPEGSAFGAESRFRPLLPSLGQSEPDARSKISAPFAPSLYWGVGILFLVVITFPVRTALFVAGLRWFYIFLFSSFVSFLLTAAVRRFAFHRGAIDLPGPLKVHTLPTPRLGGVAVYLAVLGAIATNAVASEGMVAIIIGGSIIALVGYLDDLKGVPPRPKLLAQAAAATIVIMFGKMLTLLPAGPVGTPVNLFLTFLWIIGITNALNFFDGMDGLAAGLSMIVALFLGVVAYQTDQPYLAWMAVAIFGACLGFLPYNFRPGGAAIFLGDSGSTFLGFTLAALAVKGNWADLNPIVSLSNPILIFGVLIYDMIYITLSRIASGKVRTFHEWLAYVGHDHLHHRLATLLGSQRAAVITIFLLSGSLGTAAIVLRQARTFEALLLLFQAALFLGIITILEIMANRRNRE